ncbi:adenosylcobinamide-GDP ribazoletransferase [Tabrizicola oligotrophica]|uniref:Adenosylcobinamide-GDP ribazoletransferase n=1 Tax=Tabrizicola oligotrophica TaxID=2710650 RepID=A0A6M0QSJ7_9RHOB|nr:adenosylcobinamide-GDP ribazoletransferase [Tabrizicola oligotrophica]NEY89412.1 adenosylcobinamide-GDP ribazoletransferase [Tabrizicola oligotrophica]
MTAPIRDPLRLYACDIVAGFGLLTRIPVPFTAPRPEGVWAWPLVGLVTTGLALAVGAGLQAAGVSVGVAAAAVIALQAALTGGLHEDGLADCADGFWGGHDKARRLEIMKDSRIGSYGGIALTLALLMRWSALAALMSAGAWGLALAPALLSRAAMGLVMAALPNARAGGLSAGHGRPPLPQALAGSALALALGLIVAGWAVLALALVAGIMVAALAMVARAKIGGQTGDVLGAAQVIAEIAALAAATSFLK